MVHSKRKLRSWFGCWSVRITPLLLVLQHTVVILPLLGSPGSIGWLSRGHQAWPRSARLPAGIHVAIQFLCTAAVLGDIAQSCWGSWVEWAFVRAQLRDSVIRLMTADLGAAEAGRHCECQGPISGSGSAAA